MGKCKNCQIDINFNKDEIDFKCPNCGQDPYICWSCYQVIDIKNSRECPICHFYYCNDCKICGPDCITSEIYKSLIIKYPILKNFFDFKFINDIINFTADKINKPDHKTCPNHIPISYAKSKLRNIVLKLKGKTSRSEEDRKKFDDRLSSIFNYEKGKKWTINKSRKDGEYGNELRDASNLAVCLGEARIKIIVNKGLEFYEYEKFSSQKCSNCNLDILIAKKCPKCKHVFTKENEYCDHCTVKKGKDKGQSLKLKEFFPNIPFCQLERNNFIIKNKKVK